MCTPFSIRDNKPCIVVNNVMWLQVSAPVLAISVHRHFVTSNYVASKTFNNANKITLIGYILGFWPRGGEK